MRRILLIDTMGSAFFHFHAKETNLPYTFTKNLREIVRAYKVDKTLLLQEGGSNYRLELLPTYKEARKKRRENQSAAEKSAYDTFVKDTETLAGVLSMLGCEPVKLFGAEADDLAGYFCAVLPSEQYQILLLTEDSDWSQLLSRPNTVVGSYKAMAGSLPELPTSHWLNYGRFTEARGLTPDQWFEKKLLTGDNSDSIPGIEGLGDTGATRLLQKYDSLANILDQVEDLDVPRLTQKAREGLKNSKEVLERGFQLMYLRWSREQWLDILKQKDRYTLTNVRLRLDEESRIDTEAFTEYCYEQGWLTCLDPQWLTPFQNF